MNTTLHLLDELSECRRPDYPVMQGCTAEPNSILVLLCRNRLMALLYWIFANRTNVQQNSIHVRVRFDYCISTTTDLMCAPPWFRLESIVCEMDCIVWSCDWHYSKRDKGISFCILHLGVGFAYFILVKYFILWTYWRPPLWSSGQSFWLQIQRSRVRFPALPDFSE